MKNNFYLKIYVDSTFEPKSKQAYCCYQFEGLIGTRIQECQIISMGISSDSAFSEYLGIEKSLIQIEKYLKNNKISHSKITIDLFTDLQVLPRQYKKWIPPPKETKLIKSFARICEILKKFKKADIFWIERKNNPAGKILEKFIKEGKEKIKKNDSDLKKDNFNLTFGYLFEKQSME